MRDFIRRRLKSLFSKKKKKGFSLIELMIVLAIIGFLTAMAVPNFLRFQLKAKQSEAKAQLGALYMAQKAFFAEWSTYFPDFRDLGYTPEGNLTYRISLAMTPLPSPIGYTYIGGACAPPLSMNNCTPGEFDTTTHCAVMATGNCTELSSAKAPNQTPAVSATAFKAEASADLDSDSDTDHWTIDQDKNLANPDTDL